MSLHALLIGLLALFWLPLAQDNGLSLSARAGYDGLYREGAATPLVVSVRNDGPAIEGEIRVAAGGATPGDPVIYSAPVSLPTQSEKRIVLYVHLPSFTGDVPVQLVSDGEVVAEAETGQLSAVLRGNLFYGVVTPDPGSLAFLETVRGGRPDADVAFLDLADLPDVSPAWDALDLLVLDDVDTARLTAGQLDALWAWLENGGELVVTGGPGGPKTAAGLADLLPVNVTGVQSVADLPALADYAGSAPPSAGPYVVTTSTLREGETLIHQDGLPLLARRQMGRGGVTFLALDPKLPPLAGWSGQTAIWEAIVDGLPVTPPWGHGVLDGYSAVQAVSVIPGLSLPSVGQLFLFLFVYTLVIGPVNYLILRRLNRRELAWVTIPLLVLLFSAATYFTGFRARGGDAMLNQMAVAYGSIEADRVRTQTVFGLYSPRRARFDLALPYDSSAFPFTEGFGIVASSNNLEAIVRAGDLALNGIRTDTGQIATFIAEAHLPRPALSATARPDESGAVEVTVRNDGAATLENAVILYQQQQIPLGNLASGAETSTRLTTTAAPATIGPATPTPDPLFIAGPVMINPLINDPSAILGTSDYFNDPKVYPRWQLLQALNSYSDMVSPPAGTITLGGWLNEAAQVVDGGDTALTRSAVTLVLLEIPVQR